MRANGWVLIVAFALAPSLAYPCGNSYYRHRDSENELLAEAEADAKAGRYEKARKRLQYERFHDGLERKRREILALADIRSGFPTRGSKAFRMLLKQKPGDAFLQTRLAEGLSRTPYNRDEAKEILERLAREDSIADAEGYWTLAALRHSKHEDQAAAEALSACRKLANAERCPDLPAREPQS